MTYIQNLPFFICYHHVVFELFLENKLTRWIEKREAGTRHHKDPSNGAMLATDFPPVTNFISQMIFMLRLLDEILGPVTKQ